MARNERLAQIVMTMLETPAITQFANPTAASTACSAARGSSIRDRILLAMVLYTMVRAGQAVAGDQSANADWKLPADVLAEGRQPPSAASTATLPAAASAPSLGSLPPAFFSIDRSFADGEGFSATEFRPRKHTATAAESAASAGFGQDAPMLQGTTVWQRMAEYKSQDRVRVLTLFETRSSTFSLQAGKHFGPSLQWSSRGMNRGGAARGLLDHLVSAALRQTPNSTRLGYRATPAAPAMVKPANTSVAAGAQ